MKDKLDKSEEQAEIPQKPEKEYKVSFYDCFRFATVLDYLIVLGGVFFAFLHGSAKGIFALVVSLAISSFDVRYTRTEFEEKIVQTTIYFIILAICLFIGIFGSRALLRLNAQHQEYNFRRNYLKALLKHDIIYHENRKPMEFTSQIESNCKIIVDALDLKLESICNATGALISSLIVSFVRSWQISLMVLVAAPFTMITMIVFNNNVSKAMADRSIAYSKAGAIAEEALNNIKTVVSLGGEKTELKRYNDAVKETQKRLSREGIIQGLTFGSVELIFMLSIAIISYIGSYFIEQGTINPSTGEAYIQADIFTPIYALLQGVARIPVLLGSFKGINEAKIKARKMLDVIDELKTPSIAQQKITDFKESISFKEVSFAYPAYPDKLILKNLNLRIKPYTKVAFVGESGSEKAAIVHLLQRLYYPVSGTIEFDGHDLQMIDPSWLRRNVAYVGQEPVLFSMTIRENLLLAKEDATEDELIEALKQANAFDFVMMMDNKLDTVIGDERSTQLSGGQKQRIAIARALLKDARILLLDKATSTLDRISEREIQETLNNLPGQRTMIIIAYHLSTIKEADQIVVLNQGQVEEIGKHEELMQKSGKYYQLQALQAGLSPAKSRAIKRTLKKKDQDSEQSDEDEEGIIEEQLPLIKEDLLRKEKAEENKSEAKRGLTLNQIKRLWSLAKNKKKYFILGSFGSFGHAMINLVNNLLIALIAYTLVRSNDPNFREDINFYCLLFAVVGVGTFMISSFEFTLFFKASESLIQVLRLEVFYKFLRMHMGWHDEPKNKPGNLSLSLEADTGHVGLITGTSFGIILQIILGNVIIVISAITVCWQLGLVGMVVAPFVLFVVFRSNSNEAQSEQKGTFLLSKSQVLVSEAINNMKTIISLDAQEKVLKEYLDIISQHQQIKQKTKLTNAFILGLLYLIVYLDFAAIYYLGTYLYFYEGLVPYKIIFAALGITFSALAATQLLYLIPDIGKAAHSIQKVLNYLDMQSQIDIEDKTQAYRGEIHGNVEFKNVSFRYLTRNYQVFTNLSFNIHAGQHIGLTGPSGCGKSTIIQLLLRLYDVDTGEILLEGVNIKEYDLSYLRRKIGIVSQEPVLFNGSIEYNLKYANEKVTDEQMREAVKKANALTFIEAGAESEKDESNQLIQQGYARMVGPKGSQLSRGQKQRVAIARAILRKPRIVLLDEATSALDAESEKLVQNALSTISQGLTTISIAYRFSKTRELDEIMVLKDGEIIEKGSFEEFIQKQEFFY